MICNEWKEIVNSQDIDIIETVNLRHKSKSRKVFKFSEYSLPIVFERNIHEGHF